VPEVWLPVVGYEGLYDVSNLGNVRTLERAWFSGEHHQVMRTVKAGPKAQKADRHGYLRVTLSKEGKKRRRSVHHLVLDAFVGPGEDNAQCRHLDGNKENNRVENLCWGTIGENAADRKLHGTQRGMDGRTHSRRAKRKISVSMREYHKKKKDLEG